MSAPAAPLTVSSTVEINVNGSNKKITTQASLDDIRRNGIAWCLPARNVAPAHDPVGALGVFINLSAICQAHDMDLDALAALRSARRLATTNAADIDRLIAPLLAKLGTGDRPSLPENYSIVGFDERHDEFCAALGSVPPPCENVYYSGFPYDSLLDAGGAPLVRLDAKIQNISFHVLHAGKRVVTVPLAVRADCVARWPPLVTNYDPIPARMHVAEGCESPSRALTVALDHIGLLMRSYGIRETVLQEPQQENMLLYKLLGREHLFSAELWDRPTVDLLQPEDGIFAGVRSRYKSHVNWCRKNLTMEYYSGADLDNARVREVHDVVQQCHQRVIERRGDNMTPDSFRLAIAMCRAGSGEVAIARTADGAACAIAISTDNDGDGYYAIGGQIKLGTKYPGNFIMYDNILRAKARGMRRYHTNTISPAAIYRENTGLRARQKWQIDNFFFKRGFSNDLEIVSVYRIVPADVDAFGPR